MISLKSLGLTVDISTENTASGILQKVKIRLLDQTLLPQAEHWLEIQTLDQMVEAIQSLRVRGAPLIGVAASMMVAKLACEKKTKNETYSSLMEETEILYRARPTAVNLMICLDRMKKYILDNATPLMIVEQAVQIFEEDVELCQKMAANGADFFSSGDNILTHCNTGGLATAGIGTALGVIRNAFEHGKNIHVYVDETRPPSGESVSDGASVNDAG